MFIETVGFRRWAADKCLNHHWGAFSCLIMRLVRAYITAARLSSLNKERHPTPIWAAMFFLSRPFTTVFHGPISFFVRLPAPPLPLIPHSTTPPPPLPLPLCVWQSHSQPCVCRRRYIMPSFHCTPDQREQSSIEKLLLADFFFFLFHHHIDFRAHRVYGRLCFYLLQHSHFYWNPIRANSEWSETRHGKDAPGVASRFDAVSHVLGFLRASAGKSFLIQTEEGQGRIATIFWGAWFSYILKNVLKCWFGYNEITLFLFLLNILLNSHAE